MKQDGLVAGKLKGRLGNWMFIIAACKTFAFRHNKNFLGVVPNNKVVSYNNIIRNINFISIEDIKNFNIFKSNYAFDKIPESLAKYKNIFLVGHFQDSTNIDRNIALDLFSPTKEVLDKIYKLYGEVSKYVMVQVRRGDYLSPKWNHKFYSFTKEDLMSIMNTYFPNEEFMFISDDIEWCKQNFIGNQYHFADKSNEEDVDLYLQSLGKSNIISNSTFGWWGAYLNEHAEKVVCPWPWYKDGGRNWWPDILPENWIKYYRNTKND